MYEQIGESLEKDRSLRLLPWCQQPSKHLFERLKRPECNGRASRHAAFHEYLCRVSSAVSWEALDALLTIWMFLLSHLLPVVGVPSEWKSREQIWVRPLEAQLTGKVRLCPPIEIQNSNKLQTVVWHPSEFCFSPMGDHINAFIEILNLFRKFCHDWGTRVSQSLSVRA